MILGYYDLKIKLVLSEETTCENLGENHKQVERIVCKAPEVGISLASPKNNKEAGVVRTD